MKFEHRTPRGTETRLELEAVVDQAVAGLLNALRRLLVAASTAVLTLILLLTDRLPI
jgi:hypothetical protein